jgi:hypothetical protein
MMAMMKNRAAVVLGEGYEFHVKYLTNKEFRRVLVERQINVGLHNLVVAREC